MASVLEGFLVTLGFDVDKDDLAKFNQSVAAAGQRFVSLAKTGLAAGAAMGAAFLKASDGVNDLYKISNNTGASIKGIQTLQGAVERVGGSAENVTAAFQDFALKSKTFGAGFEQMVRNQVGVSMRDAQGNARDMALVLADVSKELARMAKTDPGMARMKAEALGLGGIFDDIVKKDFPRELERSAKMAGVFGDQIDQSANASHRLMNEVSQVWDTIGNGAMAAAGQITDALDLDDKLANFNDHFADWLSDIVNSQLSLIKKATGIFDWFGSLFTDSGDALDEAKIERLEKKAKAGAASKEEQEELASLKKEREENQVADKMYIDRDAARAMGLHEKRNDDVALKAQVFGVSDEELKDPKKRKELEERRITTEDLAELSDGDNADANTFMLALELKKRQDAKAGPSYFEQPAWTRDAPQNIDNSSTTTNTTDEHRSASTTVNQSIVINGGGDPVAIGQAVASETQKTIARNSKRSLV